MAGKGGRRGEVILSKTARASVGDKGAAWNVEWSRHSCDACHEPIRAEEMVTIRELRAGSDVIAHYHPNCAGLPAAR